MLSSGDIERRRRRFNRCMRVNGNDETASRKREIDENEQRENYYFDELQFAPWIPNVHHADCGT